MELQFFRYYVATSVCLPVQSKNKKNPYCSRGSVDGDVIGAGFLYAGDWSSGFSFYKMDERSEDVTPSKVEHNEQQWQREESHISDFKNK
ncbi:hypothetical protein COC52_29280 [Priestia megaterium]|uniref:hypothetical protein n=1 Tax=Priestia megaterium TaxID=1404 RepID=UPI000BFB8EAE|nr:hypothetical protein [Priestia megaterium]PGR17316.1 hypothetical protein COC52_29280 [Priestia megaterium]